jgi:hypothetical protein
MARETHFASEIGVSLKEKIIDSVRFVSNNSTDVLPVCTLIKKYILYSRQ